MTDLMQVVYAATSRGRLTTAVGYSDLEKSKHNPIEAGKKN